MKFLFGLHHFDELGVQECSTLFVLPFDTIDIVIVPLHFLESEKLISIVDLNILV